MAEGGGEEAEEEEGYGDDEEHAAAPMAVDSVPSEHAKDGSGASDPGSPTRKRKAPEANGKDPMYPQGGEKKARGGGGGQGAEEEEDEALGLEVEDPIPAVVADPSAGQQAKAVSYKVGPRKG
jgi:hypothetical protein